MAVTTSHELDGTLVVRKTPGVWVTFILIALGGITTHHGYRFYTDQVGSTEGVLGLIFFVALFFGILTMTKIGEFRFDPNPSILYWRRYYPFTGFWSERGEIPFDDIQKVKIDRLASGAAGKSKVRLCLKTKQGDHPLSNSYSINRAELKTAKEAIATILGLNELSNEPSFDGGQDG